MRSTSGESVSSSPTRWSERGDDVDDAGGDVGLLGDQPAEQRGVPRRVGRRLEHHGVAGGERLADLVDRHLEREVPRGDGADDADRLLDGSRRWSGCRGGRGRRAGRSPTRTRRSAWPGTAARRSSGTSSCGPLVSMRGQPTSRISCSRSSSCSPSSASCSCSRQCLRKAWFVDQSVSSNARRAATIACCMSAVEASVTWPMTSSVAGLMLSNVCARCRLDELAVDQHPRLRMHHGSLLDLVPLVVGRCANGRKRT